MKNLFFTLLCLVGITAQLLGQQVPPSFTRTDLIAPSQIVPLGSGSPGGSRALQSFELSYHDIDRVYSVANSFTFGYFTWDLNFNARINTNPYDPSGNDFIRWGAVLFDTIRNYTTGTSYPLANTTNMTLDTVILLMRHTNVTGLNDTLIITVFEAANTASSYTFAPGSNGLTVTNPVIHRDTFIFNTSQTPNINPSDIYRVPVEMVAAGGGPVTIPQGKAFIIQARYHGPLADLFEIADGNRLECGQVANTAASISRIPANTARYYNIVFPPDPPAPADSSLTGVGQLSFPTPFPTNCNQYYFQNLGISAAISFDDGAVAACPDAPTGTPGFRPNYNALACINQSTPYTSQVSFEVPSNITTPFPATVNSVRIDSIRNLPCGITYTLDRVNATYNGGEVGCVTFNGTTTSPVGPYSLRVFATVNTNFGSFPGTDLSTIGFEYYLRVIANGATTCATVASGTPGLTANCPTTTPLVAAPSAANPTICRGNSTTLNANASGGTTPYTYAWSASGGGVAPAAVATPTVSPTVTTTYTVTVTATGGATATGTVTVNVTVPSATITPNGPTTFCQGGSVVLSAPAGHTYQWTGGTTNQTLTVTTGGTYSVTTTLSGCTATSSVTVTVNNAPSAAITGSTTICAGGNTTLTAPAGLQYAWSTGGTGQSITVTTGGNYSVTTTQNGCTATSSVNVTVGNPPATITPNGPTTFCTGGNVVLSAPAGYTYTWSANAGSSTNQTVTATQSGTYSVTVSAGGSCTATSSISVTVNPTPSATITPNGPTTFCTGGSVVLSAPAGNTYLWSANAGNATTQTVTATQSGTYSVTVTSNGCTATSSVTVSVTNAPSAVITPNGPTTFCTGGNVVLSAPAGLTYQWSANTGNSTNQTVTASQSGTYSVTTTQGSCTATSSVVVNVVSAPSATITPNGPTTFCAGGNVVLSAPAGYDYAWSANAGSATTRTVTVTQSGTYNVTVSAGASCTATSSATVTVNALPTVTISASGATTFCTGGSVTLTASSGTSYLWSNGSTSSSISATQAGTYEVTVTSANGCSNTASQVVNVVSTPSATITPSGSTSICPGSSVTLSAPSGYTYSWSNSATTESITVQLAGTYSVTVSAGASCTAASSITVSALTAPDATVTPAGPVTICAGETVTLSAVGGLLYQWSNGATTQNITPTLAGTYTVTVTNANNCEAVSAPITVNAVNPPATPTVTYTNEVLSSSSAAAYQWYRDGTIINGAEGQQYTPTQNGSYTVVITDASGCSSQSVAVPVVISSIADVVNKLTVTVQPNPSTGIFYLSVANLSGTSNIVVLDMAGREVFNQSVEGQLQQYPLDLSLAADGVYILRLSNGDAVNNTRLIVY